MMKRIVQGKPGSLGTDLSRDYVYTEWDGVTRFAEHFADDVESRHRAG
jgi:menaquinone-dependent protoporphyrinogen oxidase